MQIGSATWNPAGIKKSAHLPPTFLESLSQIISPPGGRRPKFLLQSCRLNKIADVAKKAGVKTVYAALLLYYVLTDSKMPIKDRAVILGALGYFICPVDAIPDLLGPLGYTDDLAALGYALKSVWDNITPETHRSARRRLHEWFGEVPDSELELF